MDYVIQDYNIELRGTDTSTSKNFIDKIATYAITRVRRKLMPKLTLRTKQVVKDGKKVKKRGGLKKLKFDPSVHVKKHENQDSDEENRSPRSADKVSHSDTFAKTTQISDLTENSIQKNEVDAYRKISRFFHEGRSVMTREEFISLSRQEENIEVIEDGIVKHNNMPSLSELIEPRRSNEIDLPHDIRSELQASNEVPQILMTNVPDSLSPEMFGNSDGNDCDRETVRNVSVVTDETVRRSNEEEITENVKNTEKEKTADMGEKELVNESENRITDEKVVPVENQNESEEETESEREEDAEEVIEYEGDTDCGKCELEKENEWANEEILLDKYGGEMKCAGECGRRLFEIMIKDGTAWVCKECEEMRCRVMFCTLCRENSKFKLTRTRGNGRKKMKY